jgi:hypothetical protein
MLRALLIFVNFFAIWIAGLVSGEPTADLNAPRTVKAGGEFVVEAVIHKGDAKDFLRFAQTLPAGFTASPMETDGGTFYFEQQTVKILWSKLPEKADLKVSYKVTVDANMAGEYQIAGKISYVVDNLPKPVALPSIWVTVGSGGETAVSNPVATENTTTNSTTSTTAIDSTVRPAVAVTASRLVPTEMVKNEFQVDIAVDKGDLRNFAKIQDSLPDGFSAKLIKSDGAEFEFKNNVVTFRWYAVPSKTILNVSYKVILSPDVSGVQTIRGHFSYIEDDKGKNVFIAPSTVNVEANAALAQENSSNTNSNETTTTTNTERSSENTTNTNTASTETTTNTNAANTTNAENTSNTNATNAANTETTTNAATTTTSNNLNAAENTSNTATTSNTENTSSTNVSNTATNASNTENTNTANTTSNTETARTTTTELNASNTAAALGIRYSVQIAAMSRMVPIAFFANAFSISAPINAEQIDGLNKYTTGAFTSYADARGHREFLRNKGVVGAFVTAYNNNKRVTVQEALMISGQTWLR